MCSPSPYPLLLEGNELVMAFVSQLGPTSTQAPTRHVVFLWSAILPAVGSTKQAYPTYSQRT